jgi:hypothetical protein
VDFLAAFRCFACQETAVQNIQIANLNERVVVVFSGCLAIKNTVEKGRLDASGQPVQVLYQLVPILQVVVVVPY